MTRALLLTALLLATPAENDLEVPAPLATLLATKKWDATPRAFRLIALSNLADGCVAQAQARPGREAQARACVASALTLARAELPAPERSKDFLFVTHFNLVLGAADALGPCPDPALHQRLSEALARASLEDPTAHAASYASTRLRWPADQAATLASLHRYDVAHGATLTAAPLQRWVNVVDATFDSTHQLPASEVTGHGVGAKVARGCAQSYISRYLAEVDPARSATWWRSYVQQYLVTRGPFPGFREWPVGAEHPADDDSGPIIVGIGTAASAFGIAAAKAQGDALLAAQLEGAADLLLATGVGGKATHSMLSESIHFEARWQRPLVK
jgi:hypothetical protein